MHAVKIELKKTKGDCLFQGDFGSEQFAHFAQGIITLLAEQKVLAQPDKCLARMVLRSDANAAFGKLITLAATGRIQDGQGSFGIAFDGEQPPASPITYFTMRIFTPESESMFCFDVPVEAVFGGVITKIVQHLLDKDILNDGEHFRLVVSAQPDDRAVAGPKSAAALPPDEAIESADVPDVQVEDLPVAATAPFAKAESDVDDLIVVGEVEQLVKPRPKSIKDFDGAEPVGHLGDQEIPIYMQRGAMEVARQSAGASAKCNEEVGGFLLGNVFQDPETDRLFVQIDEAVQTDRARGTYVRLEFNYEAWRQVLNRIEGNVRDKILVGWYHTHLISMAAITPVENVQNEFVAAYQTFFSSLDVFIHRNFFPHPWHVGLVMDLRRKKEVFFAWKSGEIAPTQGFYLYGK